MDIEQGQAARPEPEENVLSIRLDHLRARLAEASEAARDLITEAAAQNIPAEDVYWLLGTIERLREHANEVLL